jgi:diacylglycerol kinase family enzyme
MSFERYIVLCNPVSTDAHKTAQRIREIRQLAPQQEIIIINTVPGGLEANAALLQAYGDRLGEQTLLCIAGGDGTVNMALNILLGDPSFSSEARRTPILPLWAGNANDLACMLNGSPLRTSLKAVLTKGRVVAIHPLVCKLEHADGTEETHRAASYASFGASGFAMQKLERSIRTRSPMRQPAVSRFGLEFVEVSRLLLRAPRFAINEAGKRKVIFERVFLNGSRFAKIAAVPLSLTERRYHRATVGHKSLWTLLFHLAELVRDRAGRRVGATHDEFTVLDTAWAQFDGEPVRIPAGTHVDITLSDRPFYALSTKLKN